MKKKKIKDLQLAMLQIISQNHATSIENITLKNKEEIEMGKAKAKDIELKYLQEMIAIRDSVITQTKKQLQSKKMELIIEEDNLETPEDIQKRMKISFPSLTYSNTNLSNTMRNRNRSVSVRVEGNGGDTASDLSMPTVVGNAKRISSTLKLAKPIVRKNNYIQSNLRYIKGHKKNATLGKNKNTSSLPKLSIGNFDKPKMMKKPSIVIGPHPKKPYLKVKGTRKMFERAASPGGASTLSDRTTTSLPQIVKSDTETSSTKQPISYKDAVKKIKSSNKKEIKAKDRMRLDRFKKENFIYSAAPKKLSLAEKYKPINPPAPVTSHNTPNNYLSKFNNPPPNKNIVKKEEKRGDSSIPGLSYTERMKNNISKLNLLGGGDTSNNKTPLKGILKKKAPPMGAVNSINSMNLKANTIANSKSRKFY
mmetsp:Transcript_27650/g.27498  ORF Transcript_27650/g.27498 Transcript_27650/m.27498 type:complete len:422 (-) Transcript_27650:28-1293(-)